MGSSWLEVSGLVLSLNVAPACAHDGARHAQLLKSVNYAPQIANDLKVSTPQAQGLDPELVAQLYLDAAELETIYGVLLLKNDRLVAEKYFNGNSVTSANDRMSMTKSVTSALVGIALEKGCIKSVDEKMLDFFPEYVGRVVDPRKKQITIRQLLEMRAGYPFESFEPPHLDILFNTNNWNWLPHLVDFQLSHDPGTAFGYSNLTAHILGAIVSRACKTDLRSFAQENLFDPLGGKIQAWHHAADGYYHGSFGLFISARDMAKFGLTYLRGGRYAGRQVVPEAWVAASLQRYSEGINWTGWFSSALGDYFTDIGYGYQWWSAMIDEHRVDFAWGHGGNLIVLVRKLNLVVVSTADPLYGLPESESWKYERQVIDLVGKFIDALPSSG